MSKSGRPSGGLKTPLYPIPIAGQSQAPAPQARSNDIANPLRNIAFRMALVLVFIDFSCIHQLLTFLTHLNFYLLYLFGIPTFLGVALAGGVQRTLRSRAAIYWVVFAAWFVVGIPFSTWQGGAFHSLTPYLRTVFPMLFVIAGLTLTWRECRAMMCAIAAGGATIILAAKFFQNTNADRLAIEFGTISNTNDYAVHLVYILPFVMWVGFTAKSRAVRIGAWGIVCFGILLVLKTASRGAFLAILAGIAYWLIRGNMRQRLILMSAGPVMALALIAFVPRSSLVRMVAFSATDSSTPEEAAESSEMRRYLLEKSIEYTLEHPVFGLGFSQFREFEGAHNQIIGDHGKWDDPHNSYTQVASEGGIPAFALYLAAIVSTFLMINRVYRQARARPECADIRAAGFCIMLSMTMYCTGILFVNFSYFLYLPIMTSLVIAVSNAAQDEFANRPPEPVTPQFGFAPTRPLREYGEERTAAVKSLQASPARGAGHPAPA